MTAPKSHHGVTASAHTPWLRHTRQNDGLWEGMFRCEGDDYDPSVACFCFGPDRFWISESLVCSVFPFFMSADSP